MILAFTLSMPNVGSWNGKWSGEGRLYAVVKNLGRSQKATARGKEILAKKYFHYNFGDGWSAGISVKEVTPGEARVIRRMSHGFCGYGWMVESICQYLEIKTE